MKKEWLVTIGVAAATLLVAIGLIRWFAPQLLGIRADMQVVRVSEEVVPFFENVFRRQDYRGTDFILKDPYTRVRATPFYWAPGVLGPNDILGFRNRSVPNVADVVTIGDSQTYGNNASLEENWPSQVAERLRTKRAVVYSMAAGGWGAVQYLNMSEYATAFQPRVIVVAFYSGNDPLESFQMAYSVERWFGLRPDAKLSMSDQPPSAGFPPPESEQWKARLRNGRILVFTPKLRLTSNYADNPAVRAGYTIMGSVAQRIVDVARSANAKVVFTVIPTKELVYTERLRKEDVKLDADYAALIRDEQSNIQQLVDTIKRLDAQYVDVVSSLQQAAINETRSLYPYVIDGHPLPEGYRVIAASIAPVVDRLLSPMPEGLVATQTGQNTVTPYLVRDGNYWSFASQDILKANGWRPETVSMISARDLGKFVYQGTVEVVDPKRFGPRSSR